MYIDDGSLIERQGAIIGEPSTVDTSGAWFSLSERKSTRLWERGRRSRPRVERGQTGLTLRTVGGVGSAIVRSAVKPCNSTWNARAFLFPTKENYLERHEV